MATIQFYHLTATPLARALPKLLEKATAGGFRSLVLAADDDAVSGLDELLWTYDAGSFMPHGMASKPHAQRQSILLSTEPTDTNNPNLLLVTDGRTAEAPDNFARVLDIFDGRDDTQVQNARTRWVHYKNAGHTLTYLKQTESGGWSS